LKIQELIDRSHKTAIEHGWWDGEERSIGDQFTNFHAEVSEAWEEYRNGEPLTGIRYEGKKPVGLPVELADVLIRIFDTCGRYKIPLEEALRVKLDYNETRPYRHGGKVA